MQIRGESMNIPQETRRQAYEETRKMASSRRFEILKLLAAKNRPLSSRELAYLLGFHDCNKIDNN